MTGLDVLFINPGGQSELFQALSERLTAIEPPLWCRLLAGYCRSAGWKVGILDAEALGLDAERTAGKALARAPGLICMVVHGHQPSASTQKMVPALAAVAEIRKADTEVPIIFTGGHVAALPERTLRNDTDALIDFVCTSEGPHTLDHLLRSGRLENVPGLAWREGDGIRVNHIPPLIKDLSTLTGNVWRLLSMDRYRSHNWQTWAGGERRPYAAIYTSLGCPYRCSFCCINAPFHTNRYRMRSPQAVADEVRMLGDVYGVRTLKIIDEMFILNERHYTGVCEALAELPWADELNIWAYARIDTVREGHLPLLRRAGIRWLALGIESGSAHVRDGAEKTLGDDDIIEAVATVKRAGINVVGNFIFGLPDDDLASMRRTLDLANRLNCEYANFYVAMAYPGSRLFTEADPLDLPYSWAGYSQHARDTRPLGTATLSPSDIVRFRDDAFHEYFTAPAYRDMVGEKFGETALADINMMLSVNLERETTR